MKNATRSSNLELFRIIMMLSIIAHHLVANSGVMEQFDYSNITANMVFLQLFGFSGKTMINDFILITGYFMVKSKFSFNKVVRLYLEMKLYKFLVYLVLAILGYQDLGIKALIKTVFSVAYSAGVGFTGTFFILYLLIPFINKFVLTLNKTTYTLFLGIMITFFTVLSSFLMNDTFSELGWYFVVYMIGGYIRLYPVKFFENRRVTGVSTLVVLALSYLSIIAIDVFNSKFNLNISPYFFVMNANKILALLLAVFMFSFFKNINIKSSKLINTISSTTFGVLLIHANSYSMRNFLWGTLLDIKGHYTMQLLPLYSIVCVIAIYMVCVVIDLLRIKFVETPLFNKLAKCKKYISICNKIDNAVN